MLLKNNHTSFNQRLWMRRALLLLAGLVLVWGLSQWSFESNSEVSQELQYIYSGAEKVVEGAFVNNGHRFGNAEGQSDEMAFKGTYSCKLDSAKRGQYGLTYVFPEIPKGKIYQISVWRYRPEGGKTGALVASGEGEKKFYKSEITPVEVRGGWEKLLMTLAIPNKSELKKISVYVFTNGQDPVFFDELIIEQVEEVQQTEGIEEVAIEIKPKAMAKLQAKRAGALRVGILQSADDDWVNGKMSSNKKEAVIPVSLRLKGDWLDHLEDDKWSFRLKSRKGSTWNRMYHFSLQTPEARYFLHEWLLHELFKKEDVLTTRYDFIRLTLNGKSLGVYAYEEFFDKTLVEYQKRREGPIVKFTEDGFWEGFHRANNTVEDPKHSIRQEVKMMENSEIKPFKEKKTLASPTLQKNFESAQQLMQQYREGGRSIATLFDIDKLAKYYAIMEVIGGYHGTIWHNQRFYFNPVTNLLEPIGYDGFASHIPWRNYLLGHGALNPRKKGIDRIDQQLFFDETFVRKYTQYLYQFSSKSYINTFLAEMEDKLRLREALIQEEFKQYKFDFTTIREQVQRIQVMLLPYDNLSLRAHTQSSTDEAAFVKVANLHGLPIELIGSGPKPDQPKEVFKTPILLESFIPRLYQRMLTDNPRADTTKEFYSRSIAYNVLRKQEFVSYHDLEIPPKSKYLFYKPLGLDTTFVSSISKWPLPEGKVPTQELFEEVNLIEDHPVYRLTADKVYFPKGQHRIENPIVIPENYQVVFEAGCELDMVKKGMIVSRSPVFMYGSAEAPVKVFSSDQKGQGLTVLQAAEKSIINYAIFDNLSNLSYKNWLLTGAVTFYESDVDIEHSAFNNNHCEDALNVIRSSFNFKHSRISNTFADGLDADFCKGTIYRSSFFQTGNDALDVSGSNIIVDNCLMEQIGDKGISVGEQSDATVFKVKIKDTPIGLASKDLSILTIHQIELINCGQGFTAYQKKPEYGGGKIFVKSYKAKDVKRLHNIRSGSELTLKGKKIIGE